MHLSWRDLESWNFFFLLGDIKGPFGRKVLSELFFVCFVFPSLVGKLMHCISELVYSIATFGLSTKVEGCSWIIRVKRDLFLCCFNLDNLASEVD